MTRLYEAKVSTNMLIVANGRESAIETAKLYASDEIVEFCEVNLKEIIDEKSISEDWKDLYPYISNNCIQEQKKCIDLIREIGEEGKSINKDNNLVSTNDTAEKKDFNKDGLKKNKYTKEKKAEIMSPSNNQLPKLRF